MKVIDYNPMEKIPPLHENDVTRKMVIGVVYDDQKWLYVSFAKNRSDGMISFFGARLTDADHHDTVNWIDTYNHSATLLGLLINDYQNIMEFSSYGWKPLYLIIESLEELMSVLDEHQIKDPLRENMVEYWKYYHPSG